MGYNLQCFWSGCNCILGSKSGLLYMSIRPYRGLTMSPTLFPSMHGNGREAHPEKRRIPSWGFGTCRFSCQQWCRSIRARLYGRTWGEQCCGGHETSRREFNSLEYFEIPMGELVGEQRYPRYPWCFVPTLQDIYIPYKTFQRWYATYCTWTCTYRNQKKKNRHLLPIYNPIFKYSYIDFIRQMYF